MRLLRPTSIRQRLLLISGTISLMTLLVAGSLFVLNDVHMLRGQMVRDLEVLSGVVGDNCLSALVFDAPETAEKNLATLRREYQIRYAVLYDAVGRPFADYRRDQEQIPAAPMRAGEGVFLDTALLEPWTLEVVRPLDLDGQPVGRIFIHARMDELAAQLRRYAGMVGLLFLVTLTVSLLLALRLQRRVSDPILHLAAKTRDISARGDYSVRVSEPVSDDEIATLFSGFNAMLEQIDRRERDLTHIRAHLEQLVAERTRALDGSLREQRLILENLPLGVIRVVDRRIAGVNPRAAELFGVREEDMVGLSTEQFYPNRADFEEVGRVAYRALAAGEVYREDRLVRRKDGSRFWCRMIGQGIEPGAPEKGSLWILDDIDRDKALEEAMRKARETAEAANRAKDGFLANMSHDLRTPLNSVLGFAQLLERDRRLDRGQQEQVRGIRRAGERLLGLIDDVLDLRRIEAGRLELVPTVCHSGELLRELGDMFRARAAAKGIVLQIEASDSVPPTFTCAAKRLHQVLVNLLDNAVKYTDAGSVTLRVGFVDGALTLAVADTGVGISPAERERIFEPFHRVGASGDRTGGTGLGLAIAKGLVEGMGGTISVESVPGEGSTFRVRVPAASGDERSDAGAAMSPAAGVLGYRCREGRKPLRVLVVDDEFENRQVLRGLLEALGFAVQEAEGGSAAITAAEAAPPDLVLMDLRMPEMDGIAAARALRERPAFRHLPIVAVTAAAFAEDRERALTAGFDAHLAKPVLFDALIETLGTLLPIEWERGEARDQLAPAGQERLPRNYAERLERLVQTGSVTAVRALAADWAQEGCCPLLAQRLTALADEFDLVGLRRLAEEVDMAAGAEGTGLTSEGNPSGVAKALRGD